jgi:hypothetical protein
LCILWIGVSTEMALELWCIGCICSFWWLGAARLQLCWGQCNRCAGDRVCNPRADGPGSIGDGTWQFLESHEDISFYDQTFWICQSTETWAQTLSNPFPGFQLPFLFERAGLVSWIYLACTKPTWFSPSDSAATSSRTDCSPLTFGFPWIAIFLVVCLTWLYSLCYLRYRFPGVRFPTQRCYLGP